MNFDKSIIGLHFLLIFSVLAKFQEDQIIILDKIKIDETEKIKMKKKKKKKKRDEFHFKETRIKNRSSYETSRLKIDQFMKLLIQMGIKKIRSYITCGPKT